MKMHWLFPTLPFLIGLSSLAVQPQGQSDSRAFQGLTGQQRAAFEAGRKEFLDVEGLSDGLGVQFNGRSCGECHSQGGVGGSASDVSNARETRFGRIRDGVFDPMTSFGGPLIQRRSIHELDTKFNISGEVVPREATLVSRRITTPLFGAGLIEAVTDAQILSHADPNDMNHDGISGRVSFVSNPETRRTEIGRFGSKCQVSTLHLFSGDAYLNEMGITNPTFPIENLPQGQPIPTGYDLVRDPEDDGGNVTAFTDFMRFLAPVLRQSATTQIKSGETLFAQVGCAACHVPVLTTGASSVQVLRFQRVELYSDLLVHDVGTGDGIVQNSVSGSEFRTALLWGLSRRIFLMHDGRARTSQDAVLAHGGEAVGVVIRYRALSQMNRDSLLAFLRSL